MSAPKRQLPRPLEAGGSFFISEQRLEFASDPGLSAADLVASAAQPSRFVGRPWFVWRDDPELARAINDELATGAH